MKWSGSAASPKRRLVIYVSQLRRVRSWALAEVLMTTPPTAFGLHHRPAPTALGLHHWSLGEVLYEPSGDLQIAHSGCDGHFRFGDRHGTPSEGVCSAAFGTKGRPRGPGGPATRNEQGGARSPGRP